MIFWNDPPLQGEADAADRDGARAAALALWRILLSAFVVFLSVQVFLHGFSFRMNKFRVEIYGLDGPEPVAKDFPDTYPDYTGDIPGLLPIQPFSMMIIDAPDEWLLEAHYWIHETANGRALDLPEVP